jgi:hypothetical protein
MPLISNRTKPAMRAAVIASIVLLACLSLAACGGSEGTSTNSAAAARPTEKTAGVTSTPAPTTPRQTSTSPGSAPAAPGSARGAPGRTSTAPSTAPKPPAGVPVRPTSRGGQRPRALGLKQALSRFAKCMRANGVNMPTPSTSKGRVRKTKGLDTTSPTYRTALAKCRALLLSALPLGRRPGAAGSGAPSRSGGLLGRLRG